MHDQAAAASASRRAPMSGLLHGLETPDLWCREAPKTPGSGNDWIPSFSKLNLMQHGKQLRNMCLGVSITRLDN